MKRSSAAQRRLSGMRNRLTSAFDKECRIQTPTKVSNGAGGWRDGPPTIQNKVRCEVRFPSVNPRDPAKQAQDTTLSRAEIRLPIGTPVSVSSRITVDGSDFEVQGHDTGRSFAGEIVCVCLRMGDGK